MLSHIRVLESNADFFNTKYPIIILIQLLELFAQQLNFNFIDLASNISENYLLETIGCLEELEGGEVEFHFLILGVLM